MHEISLVQGLINQLRQLAAENQANKITQVTMIIGPFSGVVVDSFRLGYDVLSAEELLLKGSRLIIETPPATFVCASCGHQIRQMTKPEECSQCREHFFTASDGDMLILKQVQME